MTWGDHVTKQYIDDAVSAAGWKKQIVSKLPTVEEAKDNVMYLVKDDVASTETKNVYNEYILVTEEGGTKVLESLGMVSTRVDSNYLDLSMFSGNSGTLDEASFGKVLDAYNNKITLGKLAGNYYSLDYFLDNDNSELKKMGRDIPFCTFFRVSPSIIVTGIFDSTSLMVSNL